MWMKVSRVKIMARRYSQAFPAVGNPFPNAWGLCQLLKYIPPSPSFQANGSSGKDELKIWIPQKWLPPRYYRCPFYSLEPELGTQHLWIGSIQQPPKCWASDNSELDLWVLHQLALCILTGIDSANHGNSLLVSQLTHPRHPVKESILLMLISNVVTLKFSKSDQNICYSHCTQIS